MDPTLWLHNTVIPLPLQPELEPVRLEFRQPDIDETLIQSATEVWRSSKAYPGKGNEMFFNFALALRRAGMNYWEIERTLRSEAQYGRTPSERLAQISSIMQSLRRSFVSAG